MTLSEPIRYLTAADVDATLPDLATQVALAARALRAIGEGAAETPPKIGVHPRPGALLHAMPAWLRSEDLVGLKWVSAFPANNARGVPAVNGLVVLNDAETGLPICVMDAARITAVRTAAVSGVALERYAPRDARTAAVLGAGVQARSHLPHLIRAIPGGELLVYDRHRERAESVAAEAMAGGASSAAVTDSAREATEAADIVVTVGAFGSHSQVMTADWLRPGALVVAVDFAVYVAASVAREATRFLVDDRAQFMTYRDAGHFQDYPDPTTTLGEALAAGAAEERPGPSGGDGRTVVSHLGVGLADVLFAEAVRVAAVAAGVGVLLPR